MNYQKIINYKDINSVLNIYRRKKKIIVQCHGAFDLLHIGHLKHFETAKKKGDILIVSVTPDQFIDKGFDRPFFKNQQRIESLTAISEIDYVVLNNAATAVNIINKIKPDIYCKGPDYKNQKDDITGQIKNELKAVKKNKGKIFITNDKYHSSSTILNNVDFLIIFKKTFIDESKKRNLCK